MNNFTLLLCLLNTIILAPVLTTGDDNSEVGSGSCSLPCSPAKGEKGLPGRQGVKGEFGNRGNRGRPGKFPASVHWHPRRGEPGPNGTQGVEGTVGEMGARGEKGQEGARGEPGKPGEKGNIGLSGVTGDDGAQGSVGSPGENGPRGQVGVNGSRGDKGVEGPQGLNGSTGAPGDTGMAGEKGNQGEKGEIGVIGPKGDTGEQGDAGFPATGGGMANVTVGEEGSKGIKGSKGIEGEKGVVGDAGEKGESVLDSIAVGKSGECNAENEGKIVYDNVTGEITFCNGETWMCAESSVCCVERVYYESKRLSSASVRRNATDVILIVDDSGSMETEQNWITDAAEALDARLRRAGIGIGDKPNRFYVVIFGLVKHDALDDWTEHRVLIVRNGTSFTAADVKNAVELFDKSGNAEDAYEAIEKALEMEELRRDDPEVALNVALITDEARDPCSRPEGEDPPGTLLDRFDIVRLLRKSGAKLNLLANITLNSSEVEKVIAIDHRGIVFGAEEERLETKRFRNVGIEPSYTACKSFLDYGYLALMTEGAIWNLNIVDQTAENSELRNQFTTNVARIKVEEIGATFRCDECRVTCDDDGTEKVDCREADDQEYCFCRQGSSNETCTVDRSDASFMAMYEYCFKAGFPRVYNGWFDRDWPDNDEKKCFRDASRK